MNKMAPVSFLLLVILLTFSVADAQGDDLFEITKKGYIQHLGIPYANFVTGSGDGFSVELIQGFAKLLGVKYVYIQTTWADVIKDLSGKKVLPKGDDVEILGDAPIRGDAETCIYEVPDALNALKKWPGKLKVIGPLSDEQAMGCGFRKGSPELLNAFNQYLKESKKDGKYLELIKKYYEDVLVYFPGFL